MGNHLWNVSARRRHLFLGDLSFEATKNASFQEVNQRQVVMAEEIATGFNLYFETLSGDLRALAQIGDVQRFKKIAATREIQHMMSKLKPLGATNLGVMDSEGILRYSAFAHPLAGADSLWKEYHEFYKDRNAKKMDPFDTAIIKFKEPDGKDAGQKEVLAAVPVFETIPYESCPSPSGRFKGMIVCSINFDNLSRRFISHVKPSENGHVLLIDDKYNLRWAPDNLLFGINILKESEGFNDFQKALQNMVKGHPGTAEYSYYKFDDSAGKYTGDKDEYLMGYAPIKAGGKFWSIGVSASEKDAGRLIYSAYRKHQLLVGSAIMIIILGTTYAIAMSFRISKLLEMEVETKTRKLRESKDLIYLSQQDWEDTFNTITDMITVHDRDFNIIRHNKAAEKILGLPVPEPAGTKCFKYYHGTDRPPENCPSCRCLKTQKSSTFEYFEPHLNMFLEIRAIPRFDSDNRLVGLIHIVRDLTGRKRIEEEIRKAKVAWEMTFDNAKELIVLVDKDLTITRCNKSFADFARKSFHEIIGHKCTDFFPCDIDHKELSKAVTNIEVKTQDGHYLYLSCCSILDEKGRFLHTIIIATDIAELKNTETKLKQSEKELKHRVEDLEQFYKMAVGRELKMKELKEEIRNLKTELSQYRQI